MHHLLYFNTLMDGLTRVFDTPFFRLHPFFIILFIFMTVFMLFMLFVPVISSLLNIYRKWIEGRERKTWEVYKLKIFRYLISGEDVPPFFDELEKDRNKDVLIDIFFDLMDYVNGEDKKRLQQLFDKLKLNTYILQRIQSPLCYRTAFYLERLSMISLDKVLYKSLEKWLTVPSPEIRMYTMQALILNDPSKIEKLFAGYTYEMSLWEQMNYYLFFINREIEVPDFHRLALSKNRSVSLFAIRMVRMFNQRLGTIKGYESLLKNPDLEIQLEMFRTLALFGYTNLNVLLSEFMPRVSPAVRMQILTYLSKTKTATTSQLMQYYEEDTSPEFRLHVLYCIYNFIKDGKDDIEQFAMQKEDKMLRDLSVHLIRNVV